MINDDVYFLDDFVAKGKITKITADEITIQFKDKEKVYKTGQIIR